MNMKKHLRMLCLMLASFAGSLAGFAQEPQNFTDKLWNADFEKGVHGWDIVSGDHCWVPAVKGLEKAQGYHGFNNRCLQIWKGGTGGVQDNTLSQSFTDLPSGTYVFGAYMQATNEVWGETIDQIDGVYVFANDDTAPVATHRVEGMNDKWAHTAKFNVAATVTDGVLTVGARCENATAKFLTIDNATLWYFGDMSKNAALKEMAKIDLAASIAIADTCAAMQMNADTLAYLNQTIDAAQAIATVDDAYLLNEDLYWAMMLARKSAADYKAFAEAIAAVKEVAAQEWSDEVAGAVAALNELIAEAEAAYKAAAYTRDEIAACNAALAEASAFVELDIIYILVDEYSDKIADLTIGDEVGDYTQESQDRMGELLDGVHDVLGKAESGEISAVEAKRQSMNIFEQIDTMMDNPIDYSEFPIRTRRSETKLLPNRDWYMMDGLYLDENDMPTYTSKLYRFREPLTKVRFTVLENATNAMGKDGKHVYFSLSALELYDEAGNLIPFDVEDIYCNADQNGLGGTKDGDGIPALIDGDPNTFFHSSYEHYINEDHYLEFTFPEDEEYTAFSFKLVARNLNYIWQAPVVVDIRYVSDAVNDLRSVYDKVKSMKAYAGNAVGFYRSGVAEFNDAIAEAERLIDADFAADIDVNAAIDALNAAVANLKENLILPEAGKEYRILSGEDGFMSNQNVHKALTIREDTTYGYWLWWEDACADSLQQLFTLEPIENDEGKLYYAIKNVKYDLYVSEFFNEEGTRVNDRFVLSENKDPFLLKDFGYGQFGILREGHLNEMLHVLDHNNCIPTTLPSGNRIPGGIRGITSAICTWKGAAYDGSSWMFREVQQLPFAAKSISDLNFQSQEISLYTGVNTITLTADKVCAFTDLVITNILGEAVEPAEVKINGKMATVELDGAIGELMFSFTNNEGVTEVILNGSYNVTGPSEEYLALEAAYNAAVAKAPVVGVEVGQVTNIAEYDAAVAAAAGLLANGGEPEALLAATAALEASVAGLQYNYPAEGENYFIQSALPWKNKYDSEMDVFVHNDMAYWSYLNIKNLNHQWQFVDCGELKNGMPAYYLLNVGTGLYLTTPRLDEEAESNQLYVVKDAAEAAPFNIHFLSEGKVAIADSREGNADGSWALHPHNHHSGTGDYAHGYMMTYSKTDAASAMRIVAAEKVIAEFMTGIEDVEIADEQGAPAVKGIYDLFGRRIETPAAMGIYIVDGKKMVIKK